MAVSLESLFLGLDLSTQSLKAVVIDSVTYSVKLELSVSFASLTRYPTQDGIVVGQGGRVTSPTLMWVAALDELLAKLKASTLDISKIRALSASGQQHGSVYWKNGASKVLDKLSPAKSLEDQLAASFSIESSPIWMDTSTTSICRELEQKTGGSEALATLTGSRAYERFTINQIIKIARNEPQKFKETERISLISSFVASIMSGKYAAIDAADASGMNCLNIQTWDWVDSVLALAAGSGKESDLGRLRDMLGAVTDSSSEIGAISSYFVNRYGFSSDCLVIASSGDNPCSLAGLQLCVGEVAVSLGTSDTMFGPLRNPKPSIDGHIMINATESDTFMCMIVFSNGSLTRQSIRDKYANQSWDTFSNALSSTSPGNKGYMGLYYLTPEITPSKPVGITLFDINSKVIDQFPDPNLHVRGLVESQCLSMLHYSRSIGLSVTERIIATGGASKNLAILQVLSDVFGVPVSVFDVSNSAALGAAYRAVHGFKRKSSPSATFTDSVPVMRKYVVTLEPNKSARSTYDSMLQRFQSLPKQ